MFQTSNPRIADVVEASGEVFEYTPTATVQAVTDAAGATLAELVGVLRAHGVEVSSDE